MFIKSVFKQPLVAGANTLSYGIGNQDDLWLIGANLEEVDTSDNPQPDSGSIWIQDTQLDNAVSLCHGGLRNGQLSGFGAMPLPRGSEIVGKLWHCRAGYSAKLNLYLALLSDLPSGVNPSWSQASVAGQSRDYGKIKIVSVDGVAATSPVTCRPDDGYIWQVMMMWAYHDNAAALNCSWEFYDGTSQATLAVHQTAASILMHLIEYDSAADASAYSGKILVSYDTYLRYNVPAIAAGKKGFIRGCVLEFAE